MAFDPYDPCPCGSGKKFKWCCIDIHADVEQAFEQFNEGQHDAAVRVMEQVVAKHGGNPEAHGRHAQLLMMLGKGDDAAVALQKAFTINPRYPFGLLLQGQLRLGEGDLLGGLLMFRTAADAYAPEAADAIAYVHQLIADCEMRRNNPVAGRAALQKAIHLSPSSGELREAFDNLFGPQSRLPACAAQEYAFRKVSAGSADEAALREAATGKLTDALKAFKGIAAANGNDPAAQFNVGLVQAWLGNPVAAVEALTLATDLDADEDRVEEAWALAEVQHCVAGLEDQADYVEHRATLPVRDPNALIGLFQAWEQAGRLIGLRANPEQGMLTALVLETPPTIAVTGISAPPMKMAGYMLVVGNVVQFWHPRRETVGKVVDDATQRLGGAAAPVHWDVGPIQYGDVVADALIFPTRQTTELDAGRQVKQAAKAYFEERWINQPLKALQGNTPIDAAGSQQLRKRLRGVVRFTRDCCTATPSAIYDFDALKRKLGLLTGDAVAAAGPDLGNISAMSAAELATLPVDDLGSGELADAFRAAQALDAQELAGNFARAALDRPASGDRFPMVQHLVNAAKAEKDYDAALAALETGFRLDCEGNEGKRRNDYELRRGELLASKGDADGAADAYTALLDRTADELKVAGSAAEAMLRLKRPGLAKGYAERGLAAARQQNNRDMEGYFGELLDAAGRQGG